MINKKVIKNIIWVIVDLEYGFGSFPAGSREDFRGKFEVKVLSVNGEQSSHVFDLSIGSHVSFNCILSKFSTTMHSYLLHVAL